MSFGTKGAKMNSANAMQREITEESIEQGADWLSVYSYQGQENLPQVFLPRY